MQADPETYDTVTHVQYQGISWYLDGTDTPKGVKDID